MKLTYAKVDAADGKLSSNGLHWTNFEGQIIVSGISGTIIATEVASIDGYTIDSNTRNQTVVIDPGDDTQHLYYYNDPLCSLTLTKLDSVSGKPIPNRSGAIGFLCFLEVLSIAREFNPLQLQNRQFRADLHFFTLY